MAREVASLGQTRLRDCYAYESGTDSLRDCYAYELD